MNEARVDFLYLDEEDMIAAGVRDMHACVDTMTEMFRLLAVGDYLMGGPTRNSHGMLLDFPEESPFPGMPLAGPDRRFMAMPAYLGGSFDKVGMKWYGSNVENRAQGLPRSIHLFVLNDKETGAPLAIMSANLLSAYRTGAVPGVGAKYLSHPESEVIGMVGPGVMNSTSLEAILSVRPSLERLKVHGRSRGSTEAFVQRVTQRHPGLKVEVVPSIEEVVKGADIVSVATSSKAGAENYPLLREEWLKPGSFVSLPATVSIDPDFIINRARNVADSTKLYEGYAEEFGAPAHDAVGILGVLWNDLIAEERMKRSSIFDLGAVIKGEAQVRSSAEDIVLFGVGGMPIEDVAWATVCYRRAVELGVGTSLKLWDQPALA